MLSSAPSASATRMLLRLELLQRGVFVVRTMQVPLHTSVHSQLSHAGFATDSRGVLRECGGGWGDTCVWGAGVCGRGCNSVGALRSCECVGGWVLGLIGEVSALLHGMLGLAGLLSSKGSCGTAPCSARVAVRRAQAYCVPAVISRLGSTNACTCAYANRIR